MGIAWRDVGSASHVRRDEESAITFAGLLVFFDPPKAGIAATIGVLYLLGSGAQQFRTGWFLEPVVSASLIVLVGFVPLGL